MIPDPPALHRFLTGLPYPADRGTVVEHARRRGATRDVLRHLRSLPNRSYEGVGTLIVECAKTWHANV